MTKKGMIVNRCIGIRVFFYSILAGFLISAMAGCGGIGASAMRNSRTDYNIALQRSNEEQLLANLVRLRYAQSPSFLEIEGITTQLSLDAQASTGFQHGREDASSVTITDVFSFGGSVGFSSNPTITFTPLRGEDFLKQLLAPIEIEKIMLLYNSGWTLKRVLRLTVQSINGIPNAKRANGPTPENIPRFAEFEEVIDLMRELEKQDLLEFLFETYKGETRVVLSMQPQAWDTFEAFSLAKLLDIEPEQQQYEIVYRSVRPEVRQPERTIMIETRSLLGVLFFLSQNVQVPAEDVNKGAVKMTVSEDGVPFDWADVLKNSFNVKSAYNRPSSASVAINYRGSWFYIEDSDIETKATLMLVSQLFALQSGQGKTLTPILTLPVGR